MHFLHSQGVCLLVYLHSVAVGVSILLLCSHRVHDLFTNTLGAASLDDYLLAAAFVVCGVLILLFRYNDILCELPEPVD